MKGLIGLILILILSFGCKRPSNPIICTGLLTDSISIPKAECYFFAPTVKDANRRFYGNRNNLYSGTYFSLDSTLRIMTHGFSYKNYDGERYDFANMYLYEIDDINAHSDTCYLSEKTIKFTELDGQKICFIKIPCISTGKRAIESEIFFQRDSANHRIYITEYLKDSTKASESNISDCIFESLRFYK